MSRGSLWLNTSCWGTKSRGELLPSCPTWWLPKSTCLTPIANNQLDGPLANVAVLFLCTIVHQLTMLSLQLNGKKKVRYGFPQAIGCNSVQFTQNA